MLEKLRKKCRVVGWGGRKGKDSSSSTSMISDGGASSGIDCSETPKQVKKKKKKKVYCEAFKNLSSVRRTNNLREKGCLVLEKKSSGSSIL